MSKEQGSPTPTIRTLLALGTPICPMAVLIMELPLSEGCDQLWVVIDRFTKMAHYLPLEKKKKTAADLAVIFAREVWKYHGFPTDIVSDHDSRFTSET